MGREIRRVPKDWEHPTRDRFGDGRISFHPLHDRTFEEEAAEWWAEAVKWHDGDVPESDRKHREQYKWYWEWNGDPPDPKYYRPAFTEPADCYQIYQTVSEGTPVSPVFETLEAMIEWMVLPIDRTLPYNTGQDWQCMQGMTREQAENFCRAEWAPSFIGSEKTGLVPGHRVCP